MRNLNRLILRRYFRRISILVIAVLLICAYQLRIDIENLVYKNYCAVPMTKAANDAKNFGECRIPKIDPFHPNVMALMKNYEKPLQCRTVRRATLSGGKLHIFGSDVLSASYQTIHRPQNNDFDWTLGATVEVHGKTASISHEFIELTLKLTNGDELKEHLYQVLPKPEIMSSPPSGTELGLNVIIFAMDSISNGHAQRKLLKSYSYIQNVLQGYVFMGHSAVGDGTTEQLAALLSGRGEREQPEARRGMPGAKVVDNWDWIFKKAKAHGYVTSYSEDDPVVGSFNYRLLGFRDPPTDFYPRAFFLAAKEKYSTSLNRHCYGSEKIHGYHFDLATKFYEQYPNRSKFLFYFTDTSHSDFNAVQYIDEDLFNFMTEFNNKRYLNNTLLIVMGDHGWRYGSFRQTVQGKLEERLPLFTMVFPKWFKQKYPVLDKNLKTNAQRLTSWYDAYATLNHLLVYPKEPENLKHGKSLLGEIPAARSCLDASIPPHWCPCLQWTAVDHQHNHLQRGVLETVKFINELNFHEPLAAEHCSKLTLGEIKHCEVETPSNEVLRFYKSGKQGYEFKANLLKDHCNYQITFSTLPNNGIFEASVTFINGQFYVKGSVSRINEYGNQPKCIANSLPHLRKYCHCK